MNKLNVSLFVLFFLFIAEQVQAQDTLVYGQQRRERTGSFYFGLTTGLNNTWIKVDNEEQFNEHYQYQKSFRFAPVGGVVGYKFSYRSGLQLEAYLSNQGQKFDLTDDNEIGRAHV